MQLSAAHTSANTGEEMPSGSPWKFNGKKKKERKITVLQLLIFLVSGRKQVSSQQKYIITALHVSKAFQVGVYIMEGLV